MIEVYMSKFASIDYFTTRQTVYLVLEAKVVEGIVKKISSNKINIKYHPSLEIAPENMSYKNMKKYGWKDEATQNELRKRWERRGQEQVEYEATQPKELRKENPMIVPSFLTGFTKNKLYQNSIYHARFGNGVDIDILMTKNDNELRNYIGIRERNNRPIFYIIYWGLTVSFKINNHKFGVGKTSNEIYRHFKRGINYIVVGSNRVRTKAFCNHLVIFNNKQTLTINGRRRMKNECLETVFRYVVRGSRGSSSNFTGLTIDNTNLTTTEHFNMSNKAIDMLMEKLAGITLTSSTFEPFKKMVEKKYNRQQVLETLFLLETERETFVSLLKPSFVQDEISATQLETIFNIQQRLDTEEPEITGEEPEIITEEIQSEPTREVIDLISDDEPQAQPQVQPQAQPQAQASSDGGRCFFTNIDNDEVEIYDPGTDGMSAEFHDAVSVIRRPSARERNFAEQEAQRQQEQPFNQDTILQQLRQATEQSERLRTSNHQKRKRKRGPYKKKKKGLNI